MGAVYTGQYAKGLAHLLIFVGILWGLISGHGHLAPFLGIAMGFFYVYQIIDAVRSASAIQTGQAPPDPFGLARTFSTGERAEEQRAHGCHRAGWIRRAFSAAHHGHSVFQLRPFLAADLIGIGVWLFAKRSGIGGQRTGCTCDRCRARCLMGPAILVVLGVLFLIDHIVSFGRTWPALLDRHRPDQGLPGQRVKARVTWKSSRPQGRAA